MTVHLSPAQVIPNRLECGIGHHSGIEGWWVLERNSRKEFSPVEDVARRKIGDYSCDDFAAKTQNWFDSPSQPTQEVNQGPNPWHEHTWQSHVTSNSEFWHQQKEYFKRTLISDDLWMCTSESAVASVGVRSGKGLSLCQIWVNMKLREFGLVYSETSQYWFLQWR